MAEEIDNYRDILQENFYLFSRYIVADDFLERLISSRVLTIDDKEVILNQCLHPNRRQRANKLIEILLTRGQRGYEQFLEILEYQYPHVFQEVTNKEPRDPPPDFQRNRVSDRLRIIRNLPNLLEQLKAHVAENSDLGTQLCVLQQLLEVSKEENTSLEREVEMLKDVRQDNQQLKIKIKGLETENLEHQVVITTWTAKAFQLIETQSEYKDKSHDLQLKYDDLYKQFTELQNERSIADTGPKPRGHAVPPRGVHRMSPPHVDNAPHYRARLEIIEQDLNNSRLQCEELTIRMQKMSSSEANLEAKVDRLNKELRRISMEKKNLEKQRTNIAVNNESYYQTIQKKNDEIIELQNRSMEEQQRLTELMREKKRLFEQNHRLEADVQSLKAEIDKIKLRFSSSSVENTDSSQQPMSSDSNGEHSEEGPTTVTKRKIQRRKVVRKVFNEEKYEEYALRRQHNETDDVQDDGGDMSFKSNTLPAMANESSEKLFRREVAHFRYTRKLEKYRDLSSMRVNQGSYYERDDSSSPPLLQRVEVTNTVEVINPAGAEDEQDTTSESTVYTPRTSAGNRDNKAVEQNIESAANDMSGDQGQITGAQSYSQCKFLRTSSRLPTGGKRDHKQNQVGRRHVEGSSQCDSIISQSDSNSDSNVTSDFSCHDMYTVLLPKDCLVVIRSKDMNRRVTMKYANLCEKLEFKGGNHTGIYITKQCKLLELNEGEQIKGMIFNPNERVNPIVTYLHGCTLEDFHTLVGGDFINKKKEREICLEIRNSKQEYASACEWMKKNNGNGDYFFVRCNVNLDKKQEGNADLRSGDVFLIKNSCYDAQQWQGYIVDVTTGTISTTAPVLIPNMQQANMRRAYSRSYSTEDEDKGKRGGFKVRGYVYDRVLPMKASTKLPVYIFGPDTHVVSAVLDIIASNLSTKFFVDSNNSDGGHGEEKVELYRHDMHIVRGGRFENIKPRQSIDRITVLVSITSEMSSANTKKLLGDDFHREINSTTISQSEAIKQKLTESGQNFEEIRLPSVNTMEGLILSFKSYIEASQKRILWLSSSEMDEQVANRYPSYLGQFCELSKIIQLHHSNSLNQSLDGEAH